MHPRRLDTALSSAADGTVCVCDTSTAPTASIGADGYLDDGMDGGGDRTGYGTICAEASGVVSMDCDTYTEDCTLLVGAVAGSIARIAI